MVGSPGNSSNVFAYLGAIFFEYRQVSSFLIFGCRRMIFLLFKPPIFFLNPHFFLKGVEAVVHYTFVLFHSNGVALFIDV